MNGPTPRLTVSNLSLRPGRLSFDERIHEGEVIGLAGLDGNGQETFLEVLSGLHTPAGGAVYHGDGQEASQKLRSLRHAVSHGVAYLPRDRRSSGIFPTMSILDNFAISTVWNDCRAGLISARERRQRYEHYRERLSIVAPHPSNLITSLSGGNQQKVLLARALALEPRILLLNDPTRGVDIATRKVLYDVFKELAADGMALVVLSTEIEETLHLCDRVLVFRDYTVANRLAGKDMTADRIIATMFGRNT